MKNFILIILMVITIVLSGCSNDKLTDNEKENGKEQDEVVENNNTSNDEENNPDVGTHEVNFYLFYLSTCGHCHSEREWIASIKDEYPYVNFKMYEVTENIELFNLINEAFDVDNDAFPVTIIGNEYMVGYSEAKNRKFIRAIEELSTFENCDVVQAAIDGNDVTACMNQNEK